MAILDPFGGPVCWTILQFDWVIKKQKEERKTCRKFGSVRDYDVVDELDNFDLPETALYHPWKGYSNIRFEARL